MRKEEGIIVFKDWEEENKILEKRLGGIFIDKSPSKSSMCNVFSVKEGTMKKIGEIPSSSLYSGGKNLKKALNENIKDLADKKDIPVIAISTRLNKMFNVEIVYSK